MRLVRVLLGWLSAYISSDALLLPLFLNLGLALQLPPDKCRRREHNVGRKSQTVQELDGRQNTGEPNRDGEQKAVDEKKWRTKKCGRRNAGRASSRGKFETLP